MEHELVCQLFGETCAKDELEAKMELAAKEDLAASLVHNSRKKPHLIYDKDMKRKSSEVHNTMTCRYCWHIFQNIYIAGR